MFKCGKSCATCPYVKESKTVNLGKQQKWTFNRKFNCENSNIIYMIECQKNNCKGGRYIGEKKRLFRHRMAEHRGYVVNKVTTSGTGAHFNLPGHTLSDMKVMILEQVKIRSNLYRKQG